MFDFLPTNILRINIYDNQSYWMQTMLFNMLIMFYQPDHLFSLYLGLLFISKCLPNWLSSILVYSWRRMRPVYHELCYLLRLNIKLLAMSKRILLIPRNMLYNLSCGWICKKYQFWKMLIMPKYLLTMWRFCYWMSTMSIWIFFV